MSKLVTYLCDHCGVVRPFEELEAVQAYIFSPWSEAKVLDYEMVCGECRETLRDLIDTWMGKEVKQTEYLSAS